MTPFTWPPAIVLEVDEEQQTRFLPLPISSTIMDVDDVAGEEEEDGDGEA